MLASCIYLSTRRSNLAIYSVINIVTLITRLSSSKFYYNRARLARYLINRIVRANQINQGAGIQEISINVADVQSDGIHRHIADHRHFDAGDMRDTAITQTTQPPISIPNRDRGNARRLGPRQNLTIANAGAHRGFRVPDNPLNCSYRMHRTTLAPPPVRRHTMQRGAYQIEMEIRA